MEAPEATPGAGRGQPVDLSYEGVPRAPEAVGWGRGWAARVTGVDWPAPCCEKPAPGVAQWEVKQQRHPRLSHVCLGLSWEGAGRPPMGRRWRIQPGVPGGQP